MIIEILLIDSKKSSHPGEGLRLRGDADGAPRFPHGFEEPNLLRDWFYYQAGGLVRRAAPRFPPC